MWGSKQIKIKYTDQYPNVVAYTDVFTVTVACPALITNAISTTSFTYVVPTFVEANPILIIPNKSPSLTATPYAKTNSLATNCKISYALFDSSDAPYTGSLLKVNADGDVSLDINAQISGTFKVKYTYGGATADSTSFTVSVTCAPQSLSSWVPKPATQPSNCNPWTSAAFVNGPPPAGASESCDVKLQSIDTDYSRIIVSGGQTSDANRVLGKTDLKCFADFRGFVNKYTNGAKDWEKYIHGNPGSTDKNVVTGVMWIGLSKDARSNNQGVYTDMMGAYIRTTYTDLVVFINLADGSFTNVQHILLSDVGTFSGYDLAVYSPSWQDIFKFQLLSHGGSISDYRVFYAFIDKSTIDGKKWTLHSRSTTELQSSIDSSTGKFIYGAQCIQHYGNLLYWGGGREHSQPPISGVSPVIGTSSPDTLVVQSAMTFNGPMTSASDPRYIVEKIYFSRDSSNHLLAAFARKRHDTAMASVDDSVKHMLIVGRDHLSSTPWKGNVGCFDFSVYLFQLDSQKLLYIDDVVGPISSKLYVFMRTWNGNGAYNNPNYILQKSTDFDKAYVVSVEKWDGVNCVSGTTDTKTTGIFMDY